MTDNPDDFQGNAKGFIETSIAYYKLWVLKGVAKSATSVLKMMMMAAVGLMVVVFFSTAAALAIGYAFDNFAYGFLVIGSVYLIIWLILNNVKDNLVDKPVLQKFSEFFKD